MEAISLIIGVVILLFGLFVVLSIVGAGVNTYKVHSLNKTLDAEKKALDIAETRQRMGIRERENRQDEELFVRENREL